MRLVIEDKYVRRYGPFGVGCRLVHFYRADFEKRASEGLIDGNEGCGQPTGAFEKLPAADAKLFRGCLGQFLYPVLDVLLLPGLRIRHVLAVGHHRAEPVIETARSLPVRNVLAVHRSTTRLLRANRDALSGRSSFPPLLIFSNPYRSPAAVGTAQDLKY